MQEQVIRNNPPKFIFRPKNEEKSDLITNDYLKNMPRDEFLRYELIGGEIIVSTAPRYIHQLMVTWIVGVFLDYLKENPAGEILPPPDLIFSDFDGVIPDLIFITHERRDEILNEEDGKFHGAPEIVVEILSPGRANARRDLQIKRELYEMYEVEEYWVVNPFDKEVSVFKRDKSKLKQAKIYKGDEELATKVLTNFKLNIKKLFEN
ncbi:Uma2 family endonuclease [soil metagenome]